MDSIRPDPVLVPGDVIARGAHAKTAFRYRVRKIGARGRVKLEGPLGENWSVEFWTDAESIVEGGYQVVREARKRRNARRRKL